MRLSVENMTLFIGKKKLLGPLSFCLEKGGSLGILGSSGSGKSTLLKALCGLHPFYKGSVTFSNNGADIERKASFLQMVFQDPLASLHPKMTAYETLKESCLREKERTKQIFSVCEDLYLEEDLLFRYPHELSGGQRQRVSIARALLTKAPILALDECTSALDPYVEREILTLLKQVRKKRGCAFLVVSHSLKVVESLCEETIELDNKEQLEWI